MAVFIATAVFCSSARVLAAEETPDAENTVAAEETSDYTNTVEAEETPDAENTLAAEETSDAANSVTAEETPDAENTVTAEETPDAENTVTAEETPDAANMVTAEEMPDAANMVTAEEIPAQHAALSSAGIRTDDSSAVRLEAGSLSGWIIDGSKAKYYDPKTHKAYKNGTYRIKGKTIRFDKKGYALNYASVGKGKMYKRIKSAVKALIAQNPEIASSTVNNTIAYVDIYEGTYQEAINLQSLAGGKGRSASGIYFKGIGTVNWKSPANYPTGCLCGYGAITVENIRFTALSKGSTPAYAYHYEAGKVRFPSSNPGVVFKNCSFRSAGNHAVGIGMGMKYSRLTFRNCEFHGAIRDIYLHNSVYEGADKNELKFAGCSAKDVYIFDAAKWNADRHSRLILKFKNNDFSRMILDCGNMGKNAGRIYHYIPKNYPNFAIYASGGNANRVFDRKGK